MDKKQLLLVGMGITFILLLYFGGNRKSSALEGKGEVATDTLKKEEKLAQINFEKLANNLKKKIDSVQRDSIVLLETKMNAYKDSSNVSKASVYEELGEVWEKAQYIELASYYFQQAAILDSVESRWKKAGEKLAFGFRVSGDSSMRAYLTESTLEAYNNASAFDTSNLDYQIELAATYIDGYGDQGQQVMKGVFMLRDITIKDSTNIKANLLLGQMAIVSAQYDKAVARLQIVISKDPSNAQAYYYLAEAYIGLGQKEKAIEAYKDCKKWVKNPTFADQLDKYIEDLINS
ncbi:MAG: tetratricopeptide repeat protein [Chitinophagales bacterium]